jgi:hypothetical protein
MTSTLGPESLRLLRAIAAAAAANQGVADIYRAGAALGFTAARVDAVQAPLHAQALIRTDGNSDLVFLTALGQFLLEPE